MKHGNQATPPPSAAILRAQNDAFRADIENAAAVIYESVIRTFGMIGLPAVLEGVKEFDAFTPNPADPHDNGAFELFGVAVFWSIQYADHSLKRPSPNPADPRVTRRVLVLQLGDDLAQEGDGGAR